MTHAELCETAKKWLVRPNSLRGHGCHVALSECRSGWGGEMPDAIGFRAAGRTTETVVVEVKCSRADFLADAKKPHRADGEGMGLYRYFMCPEGLIQPDEVPGRWGLLWVNGRGKITAMLGPVAMSNNCGTFEAAAGPWQHLRNTEREMWLLIRVMARIDNPDKVKNSINAALREQARLAHICNIQADEIRSLKIRRSTDGFSGEVPKATPRRPASAGS
ncbi:MULTISPECIES: adenylosuccinate synthase [Pseudomonas syringae group]|uniref:adenylosuccinate synthase n=1 Tax=Pseudomonas syringae group TaxID=136849 RepID=UPI0011C37EFA|nr:MULTISPECIES: adenylosuccinate synthase [Pseudomonas syringae group]MDH4602478.1 adenylosuccinate synthase [Pseudomonas syringae pv. papulans]